MVPASIMKNLDEDVLLLTFTISVGNYRAGNYKDLIDKLIMSYKACVAYL